mmetsp:Transcript_2962/g.9322  ORF Transcript_2962/g.9322 Transcript_2962/m.9322 type:complete len:274 (+) Transcript_2962:832-1653(+)
MVFEPLPVAGHGLLGRARLQLLHLLVTLDGPLEGPEGWGRHLEAADLRVDDVEEAVLVPGRHARLGPQEAVVHLIALPWLQLEVQQLRRTGQDLVRPGIRLPLLPELDLLGDEDVVRVLAADVREVVLRDLEGEDGPEEAVDPRLLGLVVRRAGALPAVVGVAALLLGGAVARPRHLHEELLVQVLGVDLPLDLDEGLGARTAGRILTLHGEPVEVDDLCHRIVLADGAGLPEGLGEPRRPPLLQLRQRGRHRQPVHVAVEGVVGHLLHVDRG